MSRLHRPDASASPTTPTAAPCLVESWFWAGVLHDVGKIAISGTVLYRISRHTSG